MEKNVEKMVDQLGFQFDEAVQLFSEETLETMGMSHVVGGAANFIYITKDGCNCSCNGKNDPTTVAPTTPPAGSGGESGTTPQG